MPTYEYRCPEGHEFEKFFRTISAAEPVVACPTCGREAVRQMSAGAGLMFKGSGFYLTDYGKNAHTKGSTRPPAKSEGSGSASTESKGEAKSDAKSEKSGSADAKPAAPAPSTKPSTE